MLSLQGVGGAGKSVLARQVVGDQRVHDAFPGGVFWVPVGERADSEQVAVTLYRQASGGRHHSSVMSALSQPADLLRERAGLVPVVFDDVWPPADTIDELSAPSARM